MPHTELFLAAATNQVAPARELATRHSGRLFVDIRAGDREPDDVASLPFTALVCVATDDLHQVREVADVGLYLVGRRVFKPKPVPPNAGAVRGVQDGMIGLFTMVANPELGPRGADHYWRDHHAPLALSIHEAMDYYVQLSVLHRFSGPEWHGFALCGFPTLVDLREHFFNSEEGRAAIGRDTRVFADVKKSPRRVIVTEELA